MADWEKMKTVYPDKDKAAAAAKRKKAEDGIAKVVVRPRKEGFIVKFQKGDTADKAE